MRSAAVCLLVVCFVAITAGSPYDTPSLRSSMMMRHLEPAREVNTARCPSHIAESTGAVQSTIGCMACQGLVHAVESLVKANHTTSAIKLVVQDICTYLKIEKSDVCLGYVTEFAPEIETLLLAKFSPMVVCQKIHLCPAGGEECFNHHWKLSQPPHLVRFDTKPRTEAASGTFWHLTDVHIQENYVVGSDDDCGRPLCCMNGTGNAGKWGSAQCDTPIILAEATFDFMKNFSPQPDFVVWTGDDPPHNTWAQSRGGNLEAAHRVTEMVKAAFPNIPVLPALGNHETFPIDQYSLPPENAWLLDAVAEYWSQWLPESALETFRFGGYYSILVKDKLRVMSLNLMYYDPINFYARLSGSDDPAGQLAWMEDTLKYADEHGEMVYWIAHIPPGIDMDDPFYSIVDPYNSRLRALVDKYSHIVKAQFYGHTHSDSFHLNRDMKTNTTAIGVAWVAPSVTPNVGGGTGTNPSVRLYKYDTSNYDILDFTQYATDLVETNKNDKADFQPEYSFRDLFNVPDLKPATLDNLITEMDTNQTLFDDFTRIHYGSYDNHEVVSKTQKVCRLCSMKHMECKSYRQCLKDHGLDPEALIIKHLANLPKAFIDVLHWLMDMSCDID